MHHDVDDRYAVINTPPKRSRLPRSFSELSIPEATCFSNAKVACCCDALASCVVVGTLANKIAQNLPFLTSRKEYSVRFYLRSYSAALGRVRTSSTLLSFARTFMACPH
ncbi:MAG: hypothetical protein F9K49_01435 [Caedimonadaceae bacterium]|nr:MAG: hypothetical protein F9K49_01435 [Caedimonadaceae bacterium]